MGSFYTPDLPYDLSTYIDNLGAYSVNEDSIMTLELARELIETGGYYQLGVAFPGISNILVKARDTYTSNVTIPSLAYLLSLTGDGIYAANGTGGQTLGQRSTEGFQFRIYDKGAKMDTFLTTFFGNGKPNAGLMVNHNNPNIVSNVPVGPYYPQSPMVVLAPGALQLVITNLAPVDCWLQILLQMVVPVTRQSANEMLVKGS